MAMKLKIEGVEITKEYPENKAVNIWTKGNVMFSIVWHSACSHYCGYCRFSKRFVKEQSYNGILTYVPVHGGITYAEHWTNGSMVYGFDCGHSRDDKNEYLKSIDCLKNECERMAKQIRIIKKYENSYLKATTNKKKSKIIENYYKELREKNLSDAGNL